MKSKKGQLSVVSSQLSITIGWLYPDLMNTYGDRGNILVLQKRAEWHGIKVHVEPIGIDSSQLSVVSCQLLFMGGAQDTQQEIVNRDLQTKKGSSLVKMIEDRTPGLFICGAYQFLGKYYKTADDKKLTGLGIFPLYTENPGGSAKRLIGNVVVRPSKYDNPHLSSQTRHPLPEWERENLKDVLIGFENHGGRTYLEDKSMALGTVEKGFGNNGEDGTEGIVYKNAFGTYLHGPILPKNPQLADLLLTLALEKKYGEKFHLEPFANAQGKPLDDSIEQKAREVILSR